MVKKPQKLKAEKGLSQKIVRKLGKKILGVMLEIARYYFLSPFLIMWRKRMEHKLFMAARERASQPKNVEGFEPMPVGFDYWAALSKPRFVWNARNILVSQVLVAVAQR